MTKVPTDAAARITALRGRLGLRQTELARLLGVSNVTVNRWEHGHTTPSAAAWARIAAAEETGLAALSLPEAGEDAPSALPTPTSSLVGRRRELDELKALVGRQRLVTLVGPGGIGKTRLALATAGDPRVFAPDGREFVDLAAVSSDAAVPAAIAVALRATPDDAQSPLPRVLDRWAGTSCVVVLDNCEHVLSGAAEAAGQLLAGWPTLRLIATSRAPLGLPEETCWQAPPLAVDGPVVAEADDPLPEAVELFVARATELRPGFRPTAEELRTITELCRRLDGLPLAIELAAARMVVARPGELLERLDRRLALLTRHGGAERHRALETTIAWSYDLLSPADQRVFRRLGVFAGSFDLAAAERASREEALPALERLVAGSLVTLAPASDAAPGRYRLLESIRLFARDRLREAGEEREVVETLADHLARDVGWWTSFGIGPDRLTSLQAAAEIDTVEAVQAALIQAGDKRRAVAVATATDRLWTRVGRSSEGLALAERALALPGEVTLSQAVQGLLSVSWLRFRTGDGPRAVAEAVAAVELARGADDPGLLAAALDVLGWLQITGGDPQAARRTLKDALALCRSVGDDAATLRTLVNLGHASKWLGTFDDGIAAYEEALAIASRLGAAATERRAIILNNIGDLLGVAGRPREAIPYLEGALALARELGLTDLVPTRLCNLSEVWVMLGDAPRAIRIGEEALAAARGIDDREDTADILYVLASAYRLARDDEAALRRYREALAIYDRAGHAAAVAMTVEAMAATVIRAGAAETACRWLGFGDAERTRLGVEAYPVPGVAPAVEACRRRLPAETFRRAWAEGAATPASRIVVEALHLDLAGPPERPSRRTRELPGLTDRQLEVLRLVAEGRTNGEIADELGISDRTVERHLAMIFAATGTDRRAAAVAMAMTSGWLDRETR